MILEFSVRNFFSFKETSTVSFKLPSSCPTYISSGESQTNVLCVKGKNGSGKTNLLRALSFLSSFCSRSFSDLTPEDLLALEGFYSDEEPSELSVEFQIGDITYIYELLTTDREVVRETLYRRDKRKTKIIERKGIKFSKLTSEFSTLKLMKLRKNSSFISTFKHYDMTDIDVINDVYNFFDRISCNVSYSGLSSKTPDINTLSKFFYGNDEVFKFVKDIIIKCDTGISDIVIVKSEDREGKEEYYPIFVHQYSNGEGRNSVFTESSGTKSLFCQLARYYISLSTGGILCLDEFDINLHPHILPILIELFTDTHKNNKGAQFIFTTHNSEILDELGRYRVYLVEKQDNESFAYRLDEIPGDILRNDRPIAPVYNSGKIGGIPRFS